MSPHRLNYIVHVSACFKAGSKPDGQRSHIHTGSQIPFGQDGIHHDSGFQKGYAFTLRIYDERYISVRPAAGRFLRRSDPDRPNALNCRPAVIDRFRKSDFPSYGRGPLRFQYKQVKSGPEQAVYRSGTDIPGAPHYDQWFLSFIHTGTHTLSSAAPFSPVYPRPTVQMHGMRG